MRFAIVRCQHDLQTGRHEALSGGSCAILFQHKEVMQAGYCEMLTIDAPWDAHAMVRSDDLFSVSQHDEVAFASERVWVFLVEPCQKRWIRLNRMCAESFAGEGEIGTLFSRM